MCSNDFSSLSIYACSCMQGKEEYPNILRTNGHWLWVDIPRDLKCHCVPLLRIRADGSPVLSGLLACVGFTVAPVGPQTYLMAIFLFSECIIGIDVLVVGTNLTLVSWPVESELFADEKWKFLKLPSPSSAKIINENIQHLGEDGRS